MARLDLFRMESYRKGIVLSTAFSFAAKLLGLATALAIAYYFGTKEKTGLWFTLLAAVTLFSSFINSLNTAVLVPESMRLLEQVGSRESMQFLNFFLHVYFLLGVILTGLALINPVSFFSVVSQCSTRILQENSQLLSWASALLTLMIVSTLMTDILTSRKFFTLPMILNMVNNLACLASLVFFHHRFDILSLAFGFFVGYAIQILLLAYLMRSSLGWNFRFKYVHLRRLTIRNILFAQAGNVTSMLCGYAPYYLLSGFAPIIASMTFAQRVSDIPMSFIVMQFSSVAGIKLNELYAQKNLGQVNAIFLSSVKLVLWLLIPISLLTFLYSEEIIVLLYKRGAFTHDSVVSAGQFLKYLSLLFPLLAVNSLVSRLFIAAQKIMEAFWYQVFMNVASLICLYIFIRRFGMLGYPFALLACQVFNFLFICIFFRFLFPSVAFAEMGVYFVKLLFPNAILFTITLVLKEIMSNHDFRLSLVCGTTVFFAGLLLLNTWLDMNSDVTGLLTKVNVLEVSRKRGQI